MGRVSGLVVESPGAFERSWIRICYLRFMFARRVLHALSARARYLAALAVLTALAFVGVSFDALRVARMFSASRYKQFLNAPRSAFRSRGTEAFLRQADRIRPCKRVQPHVRREIGKVYNGAH
jgi:hypothetical protein